MNTNDRIERVSLTVSEKFLTVLSLLWVSLRYHFIGRNIENTHEKRTVRYKSQLICIYICHQFFFIHTSRITYAYFSSSLERKGVLCFGARSAFGFDFQNKHELRASGQKAPQQKTKLLDWDGPLVSKVRELTQRHRREQQRERQKRIVISPEAPTRKRPKVEMSYGKRRALRWPLPGSWGKISTPNYHNKPETPNSPQNSKEKVYY